MSVTTHPGLYIVASFLTGFSVMVIELVSARIVAPIIGASVFTWTSVIGLTLLGLALGGWLGGKLIDTVKTNYPIPVAFLASGVAVTFIPFLSQRTDMIIHTSDSILILNLLISSYLFFIPATLLGAIQPMLLKKYAHTISDIGSMYGKLSAVWSLGSVVGVFMTGFYFISTFGSKETILLVAMMLFLLACIFALRERLMLYACILVLVIISCFIYLNSRTTPTHILYQDETDYFFARIIDTSLPGFGPSRILFLDFDSHSIESTYHNHYAYTEMYPVFSFLKDSVKDVLLVGAGAYTMPKHFKTYYPEAYVAVSETDPELIEIGNKYFNLESYDIDTKIGDARLLLKKDSKQYDVIFGDAYNSYISVPWYLITTEWNETVKTRLTQNGIYAMNFIGTLEGVGSDYTASMVHTFRRTFPNMYLFTFGQLKHNVQNIVLVGINGDLPLTEKELSETMKAERMLFQAEHITETHNLNTHNSKTVLFTDNFTPAEKLMAPIAQKYFPKNYAFVHSILSKQN